MRLARIDTLFPQRIQQHPDQISFNCPACPVPKRGGRHKLLATGCSPGDLVTASADGILRPAGCLFCGTLSRGLVTWV